MKTELTAEKLDRLTANLLIKAATLAMSELQVLQSMLIDEEIKISKLDSSNIDKKLTAFQSYFIRKVLSDMVDSIEENM